MRIVIDMQGVQTGSRYRGIGRYTHSLVKEMINLSKGRHHFTLLLNGCFTDTLNELVDEFSRIVNSEAIKIWHSAGPLCYMHPENLWRREVAEYIREDVIALLNPDVVLLTTVFEGFGDDFVVSIDKNETIKIPTICIFYDLIPLINPKEYLADSRVEDWYFNQIHVLKRSSLLLAISESARQEAIEHLGAKKESVINISSGADTIFSLATGSIEREKELRHRFGIKRAILSYSGATDVRKNHMRLIQAYARLPRDVREKHQLVFIGGMPDQDKNAFIRAAKKAGLGSSELILTGRVSDDDLVCLYQISKGFVFPSWHEGFGLPALEAMLCGCPVIASSTSSLPEVVGYEGALFDPFDIWSISQKISQLLMDENYRLRLREHQSIHAKSFSWKNTATKAIFAIESLAKPSELRGGSSELMADGISNNYSRLIENIANVRYRYTELDLVNVAKAISRNERAVGKKQLLVDVSELINHDSGTGIQRVTRSILGCLMDNATQDFRIQPVYASPEHGYRYAKYQLSHYDGQRLYKEDTEIDFAAGDIFIGLDLIHPLIAQHNRHAYRQMRSAGVKVYFVLYDLVPLLFPEFANIGVPEGHRKWIGVVLESDGVFCISRSVVGDLKKYLGLDNRLSIEDGFKIEWFHLGCDITDSVQSKGLPAGSSDFLTQLSGMKNFLMVGTLEPRKGHTQVLDAFESLWQQGADFNLLIVGKQGWLIENLIDRLRNHPEVERHLFWLEGISDEYLEKVYDVSTCLIAASYCEGFGLPLVEAAQHKLPIIARDIPVFREVAEEHAYYFNTDSAYALGQAIQSWNVLYEQGKHPDSENMPWITWKESTGQLLQLILGPDRGIEETLVS